MQNLAKCPGCHSDIAATENACPVCLRPRSRSEIMHDIILIRETPARQRLKILLWILLAALALGAGRWAYQNPKTLAQCGVRAAAAARWLTEEREIPDPSGRRTPDSAPEPAVPPTPAAPGEDTVVPMAAAKTAPLDPAAPTVSIRVPAAAGKPARLAHCKVHGRVYDLFSLKPVVGAQVTLTSRSSGQSLRARTDPTGRYSLRIPREGNSGFHVTVRQRDYRSEYLEEEDTRPYRNRSLEQRQEAAALLLQTAVLHVPLLPPEGQDEARYDLVLLPVKL